MSGGMKASEASWAAAHEVSQQLVLQAAMEDVEKKAVKLEDDLTNSLKENEKQSRELKTMQLRVEELEASLRSQSTKLQVVQKDYEQSAVALESIRLAEREKGELFDRVQRESDALRDEIGRLSAENTDFRSKLNETKAQVKLDNTEIVPLRYEIQRLTAERQSLSVHSAWLEQELKSKNDQIFSLRSQYSQDSKKLQRELDEALGEKEKMSRDSALWRQRADAAQSRIDDCEKELQEARQEASDKALENEQTNAASKKLVAIQKQKIDRLTDKYSSVCRQIEGLKQLAKDAQREGNSDLNAREKELQSQMDEMLKEQAREFSEQLANANAKLQQALHRCEQAENHLLLHDTSAPKKNKTSDNSTTGNLSLTDLYSRIATAEDKVQKEVLLRKQAEIRVSRIEADIRAKAPELLRQRKEYEAAVERQFEYKNRLQGALEEAHEVRSRYSELEVEVQELESRNKELELDSTELAKQVQSLLASRSASCGAVDAIPAPITEMQSTNQRLFSEHRQLRAKVKDLEKQLQKNSWQEKAERLEEEMQVLIEDRKQQEVMVEQIVKQRDLFRALVNNQDDSGSKKASVVFHNTQREPSKQLEESKKKIEWTLEIAEKKLNSAKLDSLAMSERLKRYETLNADLSKTVDKLHSQISTAMANTSKLSADLEFHKNKSLRIDSTCGQLREEISELSVLKNKLQVANHSLQDALSKENSKCLKIESEFEKTKVKLRLTESQIETARKAEERASNEAKQLRIELTRQESLSSSVQRIEATLAAKRTATEESYKIEVKELSQKLSELKEDHASELRRIEEELNDRDIRLKCAEDLSEKATRGALLAEKKLLEVNAAKKLLEEKNTSLESDLLVTKEKLFPLENGNPVNDLNMKIESLTEKFNSAKKENEGLKKQISALKEVSRGSEDAVVEMTNALKIANSSRTDELSVLEDQLRVATAELEKMKQVVADLTRDLSNQRAEREKVVQDGRTKLIEAESKINRFQSNAEDARLQCKELDSEVAQLKLDAANAQQNYERELNLHSQARTDLRSARQDAENQRRECSMADTKVQNLSLELSQQKAISATEKADLEASFREKEKALEEARTQNAILHEQLEKIGDQIQDIQGDARGVQNSFPLESSSTSVELQKSISELREVIKFVRSEKEVIRVQLDAARREADRDRAAAEVARQSLDNLRSEIRQVRRSPGAIEINKMKSKLDDSERRCQLLEESNTHLRTEMEIYQQKIVSLSADLDALKTASFPLEMKQRELEEKNSELKSENVSLKREVDDWKGRVQVLVTQFNQIDPIEHQTVLKEMSRMKIEIDEKTRKKIEAEDESRRIRQLAGRASKELQQNKQLVEKQKKMISDLREEKDNITKLYKGNKLKDIEELRKKITQLEEEQSNGKKLLSGANEMNEKLRDRLRQFQKLINESKKKEALLHVQLEQARAKATHSEHETNPQTTPALTMATVSSQHGKDPSDIQQFQVEKSLVKDSSLRAVGAARAAKAIPTIPPSGFLFGPSESPSSILQSFAVDENQLQKIVVAEVNASGNELIEEESIRKEMLTRSTHTPKEQQMLSPKSQSTQNTAIPRRFSGERKELSMKEKLIERKRKLMMDMQMKQEALRKTQDEAQAMPNKEEPAAKRTKVAEFENQHWKSRVETDDVVKPSAIGDATTTTLAEISKQSPLNGALVSEKSPPTTTITDNSKDRESQAKGDSQTAMHQQGERAPSTETTLFGASFLNMKPPSVTSEAPKFQFGSSNAIKLPTPSVHQVNSIFNALSATSGFANSGVNVKPLFDNEQKEQETDQEDQNANTKTDDKSD